MSLANGKQIRIGCTHLDVVNAENRAIQVKEIIRAEMLDSLPFILGGDFNDTVGSKAIELLDERFQRSCIQCAATIPSDYSVETIDYIAFDRKHPMKIKTHGVVEETYASDHRPVVVVFSMP